MTSLEQLSLAEFSCEQTRPKFYENGHKKVLGIWLDLVLKVKYSEILIFKATYLNDAILPYHHNAIYLLWHTVLTSG